MDKKQAVLKEYFGHADFRSRQRDIVDCLVSGRDALCIMPTGAGKSVCYQVPALILDGITIVVSPLISLMKDQVNALIQAGIPAAYLNSSLSRAQYEKALRNAADGRYRILYVAPERLATPEFSALCQNLTIAMVAVDEAHCVSQWGQDFRPSYLKITEFIDSLPVRPVVGAFTATATGEVRDDIVKLLRLCKPVVVTTGFDRPNLFFSVMTPTSKAAKMIDLVKERAGKAGIIYCATRKTVEEVCNLLNQRGFSATRYHAGLPEAERRENQEAFVYDRRQIMVATNAFGMGIDKSNVAYVIHYNMPKNIESYYQEAGRAGRDGSDADCILLYSPQDVRTNQFLIARSDPNPELTAKEQEMVCQKELERLKYMTFYCTTHDCLRRFLLHYFGDSASRHCGKCSNCLTQFETADVTEEAKHILSCIVNTGQRFGKKMICDVLRGGKNAKLIRAGLHRNPAYGTLNDCAESRLRDIMECLEAQGLIVREGTKYPVLKAAPTGLAFLHGHTDMALNMKIAKQQKLKSRPTADAAVSPSLLAALKKLRLELAASERVPAYIVFSDAALVDMCRKRPKTPGEFLAVSGVGNAKLARYGDAFLALIRQFENADTEQA